MAQVTDISGSSGAAASAPASPAVTETYNRGMDAVQTLISNKGISYFVYAEDGRTRIPTDEYGNKLEPKRPVSPIQPSADRASINIKNVAVPEAPATGSTTIGQSRAEEQRVTESNRQSIAAEESDQQTEQPGFFARTYGAVSGAVSAPIQTVRNWWNGESEENTNEPRVYDESHRSAMEYSLDTADNFGLSTLDQARVLKSSHDYLTGKEN
jgi:hypothetical protein